MSDSSVSETAHVFIITAILGATVFVVVHVARLLRAASNAAASKGTATNVRQKNKNEPVAKAITKEKGQGTNVNNNNKQHKKKAPKVRWSGKGDKQSVQYPWLLMSLKGHNGPILDMDFSSDGKYLATCSEDRSVFIWSLKDLPHKENKSLRINIEYDHATFVKWSPDTKAFVIHKARENAVEVYRVEKRRDGWFASASKALTFPRAFDEDAVGLGLASNGRFVMTCSSRTEIHLWDLRGESLAKIDTYLMSTYCAKISPCGRYVVASGFAPDVKVWRVSFRGDDEFVGVTKAFELSGHTSGVYDVAFTPDTSAIATVSKDGTWKVFNTNVEYQKGEDPRLLVTGEYETSAVPAKIAITPDALVVAVTCAGSISLYSVKSGALDATIDNIFEGVITCVAFDATGKYLLVSGDKHVRIFHNVTGYRMEIEACKEKLKKSQTSATRERIAKIVHDNKSFLKSLNENI